MSAHNLGDILYFTHPHHGRYGLGEVQGVKKRGGHEWYSFGLRNGYNEMWTPLWFVGATKEQFLQRQAEHNKQIMDCLPDSYPQAELPNDPNKKTPIIWMER